MSEKIAKLLERLAEMFPNSSYQSKLERYLKTKNITDAGQLEAYIRQYETRQEYFQ
jgi:predicted transcriptional regulator with HTH domain